MRSEVIGAFQNVLNELGNSEHKVPVLELPSATDEIKKTMDEKVFDQPIRDRGMSIEGFIVESVTLDSESEKKIDNYELSSNSYMQQGTLTGAYAQAVQDAANNANGAANGMIGVGMMNMASGGMIGGVAQGAFQNQGVSAQNLQGGATPAATPTGGANFCPNCGTATNGAKFCPNCGKQLINQKTTLYRAFNKVS